MLSVIKQGSHRLSSLRADLWATCRGTFNPEPKHKRPPHSYLRPLVSLTAQVVSVPVRRHARLIGRQATALVGGCFNSFMAFADYISIDRDLVSHHLRSMTLSMDVLGHESDKRDPRILSWLDLAEDNLDEEVELLRETRFRVS